MDNSKEAVRARRRILRKQYLREQRNTLIMKAILNLVLAGVILFICRGDRLDRGVIVVVVYIICAIYSEIKTYKRDWLRRQEKNFTGQETETD